ncbi:mRNA export factor Gle1p [[Candida] anglica]|uniref:mRNA export factor GLE1 n=1 Tax=[Candida] anglica TaxID=148631 RepID=A0ABP0ECM6_9ASCO
MTRFGLPLEVESVIPQSYRSISNTHTNSSLNGTECPQEHEYFPQFQSFYDSLNQTTRANKDRCMHIWAEMESNNRSHTEKIVQETNQTLKTLTEDFQSLLSSQSTNVSQIIAEEKERRRILEEARLKKLEEERIRREKEEAERKRREKEEEALRLKKKKEEEELQRKKKEEEAKKAEEAKKEAAKKAKEKQEKEKERIRNEEEAAARAGVGLTNFIKIEESFYKYKQDIADIKQNVVLALKKENDQHRKAVGALKRKINPKFGQLSNSFTQLARITEEVKSQIRDAQQNANDLTYQWILNFVAKAIVSQAETEVTVKATAALPLARLALSLLESFEQFEYYLTARLVKKCPFIIGYSCSIESEEGRTRMGWRRRDTKWEDEVKYDERVAGICTMWSVMSRLKDHSPGNGPGIFNMRSSWQFAARMGNTPVDRLTNAHFVCLGNWWEACAVELYKAYGGMGRKLLFAIAFALTQSVVDKKYAGAARLLILGEALQKGEIVPIKEMER